MKVKIAYTVDFDDVPELLEGLLSSIKKDLSDFSQKLKIKPDDLGRMSEEFQELRTKMEVADSQLQDILQITSGWTQATQEATVGPDDVSMETYDEKSD